MAPKYTEEDIQELAASYALGILGSEEKAEFEAMLKGGSSASSHLDYFKEIMEDITYSTEPLKEPTGFEGRLFARIREQFLINHGVIFQVVLKLFKLFAVKCPQCISRD